MKKKKSFQDEKSAEKNLLQALSRAPMLNDVLCEEQRGLTARARSWRGCQTAFQLSVQVVSSHGVRVLALPWHALAISDGVLFLKVFSPLDGGQPFKRLSSLSS